MKDKAYYKKYYAEHKEQRKASIKKYKDKDKSATRIKQAGYTKKSYYKRHDKELLRQSIRVVGLDYSLIHRELINLTKLIKEKRKENGKERNT